MLEVTNLFYVTKCAKSKIRRPGERGKLSCPLPAVGLCLHEYRQAQRSNSRREGSRAEGSRAEDEDAPGGPGKPREEGGARSTHAGSGSAGWMLAPPAGPQPPQPSPVDVDVEKDVEFATQPPAVAVAVGSASSAAAAATAAAAAAAEAQADLNDELAGFCACVVRGSDFASVADIAALLQMGADPNSLAHPDPDGAWPHRSLLALCCGGNGDSDAA